MENITLNARFIKAAGVAMGKKDIRHYLNGVLIDIRLNETRIVGTDGHRCIVLRRESGMQQVPAQIIIPAEVVKAIKPGSADCVLWYHADWTPGDNDKAECKLVGLKSPDMTFTPIDGTFPDYGRILPTQPPSMEHAHFNMGYLADFDYAVSIAFDTKARFYCEVWPNGNSSAPVTCAYPEFYGVIMPMRGNSECSIPEWVTPWREQLKAAA